MTDRIEKTIELKAPISRVWRALTDHHEFGTWFRVRLDGPFVPGQVSRGQITYPGYEHIRWQAVIQKMDPERLFSFTWHPYAIDQNQDYSGEPPTLVEFTLQSTPSGTLLRIVESGFDKLPSARRLEAFRMNDSGWSEQIENIVSRVVGPDRARGDETRLAVLAKLCNGVPQSISRLTMGTNLSRQAVTKHLRVLANAGVVRNLRVGRESLFELEPQPLEAVRDYLDQVSKQWDDALARLKSHVEE